MHEPNQEKLEELQGKVVGDVGGALGVLIAYMGDQAGIYQAMEGLGQQTDTELAGKTGIDKRYLREWLSANVAFGYIDHQPDTDTFSISPEQAAIFAHDGEPTCMQGFFQAVMSNMGSHETVVEVFRTGRGRPWHEHSAMCFCGVDRFFRPGYVANLVESWLPSLDGVVNKLEAGARVADIGCGHGSSSILMAESFPNSQIIGYDFHEPSIKVANDKIANSGLSNIRFEVSAAKTFTEGDFDLVCIFDALHDMGDPIGAAKHIYESLKPGGTFMVVEPLAGDSLADNTNLLSGIFYSFSTAVCVPASKSQEVGLQLGAQAGEAKLTEVLNEAGFKQVRRAAETHSNMILEATK